MTRYNFVTKRELNVLSGSTVFLNKLCFGCLFVESIKTKIKTTAKGKIAGDKYVRHLDYGDVFVGVYVCQSLSEKLYQIVHFKYVHFLVC